MLKMVKTADTGERRVFVRHLSPNRLPFKQGGLLGKSAPQTSHCLPDFSEGSCEGFNVIKRGF